MTDTIIVGSRVHTAIQISAPMQDVEKPGLAPAMPVVFLYGTNHADAINGVGITRGVDAEVFNAWLAAQKDAHSPLADQLFVMTEDEARVPVAPQTANLVNPEDYGFQPALQRMTQGDNEAAAEQGSTVTHGGPVTSSEMAATSDTPNADTPRDNPDVLPVARAQKPATELAKPDADTSKPAKPGADASKAV